MNAKKIRRIIKRIDARRRMIRTGCIIGNENLSERGSRALYAMSICDEILDERENINY